MRMGDFPVVRPGEYRLKIDPDATKIKAETSKAGNPMQLFIITFAQPYHELVDENGKALRRR